MALPPSGPLFFSMIAAELQMQGPNQSLRSMSAAAGFSAPDAVSEFYGYSGANYQILDLVPQPTSSSKGACAISGPDLITVYMSGSGGGLNCSVAAGATLYTDSSLTTIFNGGNFYWKSQACGRIYYILDNGFIELVNIC